MKALMEYDNQVLSTPTDLALHLFWPGYWVPLKTWKTCSPKDQLTSKWNGPHLVIQTTHPVLKLQGITPWTHHTREKRAPKPQTPNFSLPPFPLC